MTATSCPSCRDTGLVCEDHPGHVWNDPADPCCGAAGTPCPKCYTIPPSIDPRRVEALHHAKQILRHLDHAANDLIVVADWLVTGRADVALAMSEQRFRHYRETHPDGPDAMRWAPDLAEESR